MDWLNLLAVQGTLKSLLQHHSWKASIFQHSAFFMGQLLHPYMTTGKTIALTRRTIVYKGQRQIWTWSTEWSWAKANRVLPRELIGHSKHPLPTTQEKTTHGHHQMVNTKIRLIIFFVAKYGEALYSQQKQDWELTMAQVMTSLLPNSDLNWRKWGKPLDPSGMT